MARGIRRKALVAAVVAAVSLGTAGSAAADGGVLPGFQPVGSMPHGPGYASAQSDYDSGSQAAQPQRSAKRKRCSSRRAKSKKIQRSKRTRRSAAKRRC
jgi:hypothetical protein